MTDLRLSAETNHVTTFNGNERLRICDDPGGSPATGYIEIDDLARGLADGWIPGAATWTYASASTFTVAGDKTAIYTVGTRLKWTQTTVKYGTVLSSSYSSPNTTVTIIVNTDYTIANAAITLNYYSHAMSPVGYPNLFNFLPVPVAQTPGTGSSYTVNLAKFKYGGGLAQAFITVTVTNAGAPADTGGLIVPLPFNVLGSAFGSGRENVGTGYQLQFFGTNGSPNIYIFMYDGTTPIATSNVLVGGVTCGVA